MTSLRTSFENCELRVSMSLPPSSLGRIRHGVIEVLNQYLMKYNADVQGVLCTYSNVRLCQRAGHIVDELPYIHFDVLVNALVFRPKPKEVVQARVNKVGSNHVGLLVAGVFNASISSDNLGAQYSYSAEDNSWVHSSDSERTISVGSQLMMQVLSVQEALGVIAVVGRALSDAEVVEAMKTASLLTPSPASKKSKSSARTKRRRSTSNGSVDGGETPSSATASSRSSKSKKRSRLSTGGGEATGAGGGAGATAANTAAVDTAAGTTAATPPPPAPSSAKSGRKKPAKKSHKKKAKKKSKAA